MVSGLGVVLVWWVGWFGLFVGLFFNLVGFWFALFFWCGVGLGFLGFVAGWVWCNRGLGCLFGLGFCMGLFGLWMLCWCACDLGGLGWVVGLGWWVVGEVCVVF